MRAADLDLAALIGSRICHDLISPIGAIGNGLELMAMDGAAGGGAEMDLIAASCLDARARIGFFRVAFGASAQGQAMAADEAAALLAAYLGSGRLRARWEAGDLPRGEVQLGFLALMCFEAAMPLGGEVVLARRDGAWHLSGSGPRLRLEPALWDGLAAAPRPGAAAVTPARVQFALLGALAAAAQRPPRHARSGERLELSV